jgi:hypothetical protein
MPPSWLGNKVETPEVTDSSFAPISVANADSSTTPALAAHGTRHVRADMESAPCAVLR